MPPGQCSLPTRPAAYHAHTACIKHASLTSIPQHDQEAALVGGRSVVTLLVFLVFCLGASRTSGTIGVYSSVISEIRYVCGGGRVCVCVCVRKVADASRALPIQEGGEVVLQYL